LFRPAGILRCTSCGQRQFNGAWKESLDAYVKATSCEGYRGLQSSPACLLCGCKQLIDEDDERVKRAAERAERRRIQEEKAKQAQATAHKARRLELDKQYEKAILSGDLDEAERIIRRRAAESADDPVGLLVDNACLRNIHDLRETKRIMDGLRR